MEAELLAQDIDKDRIQILRKAHLRYTGTDSVLLVDVCSPKEMIMAFEKAHKQRFGFIARERGLIVEALSIEAVGTTEQIVDEQKPVAADSHPPIPHDSVSMVSGGCHLDCPLYLREALLAGQRITGPAIIAEQTGTVIVEDGWSAETNDLGHLILHRYRERQEQQAIGTSVDPVMLEVFNNLFMSIAEQMGATLANTAYSVNIKERLDFSCALFDPEGKLVANAPHIPVHLGSMGESIITIIRENRTSMRPGDVYMLNAPYNGGTHLPDVTVITPVFTGDGKDVLFYVASRGHHADIGGRTPGSSPPDSRHIEEEGVLIDNFLLVKQGVLREQETRALLRSGRYPCRNIDQNMADLAAQIAANETGVRELGKMVENFGLKVVHAYMQHVQDNAEESVRRVLGVLQDCNFLYPMDGGRQIRYLSRLTEKNARPPSTLPALLHKAKVTTMPPLRCAKRRCSMFFVPLSPTTSLLTKAA